MLLAFQKKMPRIDSSAYIVESAAVIGDVVIGAESSIWFNAVIRGDGNYYVLTCIVDLVSLQLIL